MLVVKQDIGGVKMLDVTAKLNWQEPEIDVEVWMKEKFEIKFNQLCCVIN